jgi:hypothetical protein
MRSWIAASWFLVAAILRADVPLSDTTISSAVHEQAAPTLASDGESYYSAWLDWRSRVFSAHLFGSPVTADARLAIPTGVRLGRDFIRSSQPGRSSVVWNGRDYVVITKRDQWTLEAVRTSRSGEILDPEPVALTEGD